MNATTKPRQIGANGAASEAVIAASLGDSEVTLSPPARAALDTLPDTFREWRETQATSNAPISTTTDREQNHA